MSMTRTRFSLRIIREMDDAGLLAMLVAVI
jgi:hypothetical protein